MKGEMKPEKIGCLLVCLASLFVVDAELTSDTGGKLLIDLPSNLRSWMIENHGRCESPSGQSQILKTRTTCEDAGNNWSSTGIETAPADFGLQNYNHELQGRVKILDYSSHTLCKPLNKCKDTKGKLVDAIDETACTNKKGTWGPATRKDLWPDVDELENIILLLERGDCYFALKAEHAMNILRADGGVGIDAIIIADNVDEGLVTMSVPEQWRHGKISIPVVEVSKTVGDKIEDSLCGGPYTTDCSGQEENVIITLGWDLARSDNKVEWQLWSSSWDSKAVQIKKSMKSVDSDLSDDEIIFEPHYIIWPGHMWDCDNLWDKCTAGQDPNKINPSTGKKYKCATTEYDRLPCMNRCTNNGRYCAADPENDLLRGLDGADLVQENLRQMCVWGYADSTLNTNSADTHNKKVHAVYWDYITLFQEKCALEGKNKWSEKCWKEQMLQAGGQEHGQPLVDYVQKCIRDSGGYEIQSSNSNKLLEAEIKAREEAGVGVYSTIYVNQQQFHGHWACPKPINTQTCGLVSMICASYREGSIPSQCTDVTRDCQFGCDKSCVAEQKDGVYWVETAIGKVASVNCPLITTNSDGSSQCTLQRECMDDRKIAKWSEAIKADNVFVGGDLYNYADKLTGQYSILSEQGKLQEASSYENICKLLAGENGEANCHWNANDNKCECTSGPNAAIILLIFGIIVLIFVVLAVLYLYKRTQANATDFKKLIDQYQLMDEEGRRPDEEVAEAQTA